MKDSNELTPRLQTLQMDYHCCNCGKLLPAETDAASVVVPIKKECILTVQRISWCTECWGNYQLEDMRV